VNRDRERLELWLLQSGPSEVVKEKQAIGTEEHEVCSSSGEDNKRSPSPSLPTKSLTNIAVLINQ
jgi:hypothetical protein